MITDNVGQQYIYFAITLYENIVKKTVPTPVSSKTEYTVQGRERDGTLKCSTRIDKTTD